MSYLDDILKQQTQLFSNDNNGNNSNTRTPKKGYPLTLGKDRKNFNNQDVHYRIVPLEDNKFFATPVLRCFFTAQTQNSTFNIPLIFPNENTGVIPPEWGQPSALNKEALSLVRQVIRINRQAQQQGRRGNVIDLNPGDAYDTAKLQAIYFVVVLHGYYDKSSNRIQFMKEQNGYPDFRVLSLPATAYKSLFNELTTEPLLAPDRNPYPTELKFIDKRWCVPVTFTKAARNSPYTIKVESSLAYEDPLPNDYLQHLQPSADTPASNPEDFDYVHIDNPAYYNRPVGDDLLEQTIIPELKQKIAQAQNGGGNNMNSYATNQVPNMNANPYMGNNANPAPVNPYNNVPQNPAPQYAQPNVPPYPDFQQSVSQQLPQDVEPAPATPNSNYNPNMNNSNQVNTNNNNPVNNNVTPVNNNTNNNVNNQPNVESQIPVPGDQVMATPNPSASIPNPNSAPANNQVNNNQAVNNNPASNNAVPNNQPTNNVSPVDPQQMNSLLDSTLTPEEIAQEALKNVNYGDNNNQ